MKIAVIPLVRVLVLAGGIITVARLGGSVYQLWQKRGIIQTRQVALDQAKAENQRLKASLDEAQSPFFVERVAREQLGLVKEGEVVVLMEKPGTSAGAGQKARLQPSWKLWWKLFF